jgi:hypothetical protein
METTTKKQALLKIIYQKLEQADEDYFRRCYRTIRY